MTLSARIRRDPQKGKKGFSNRNGFTLIELMVVLAVVAIITSFALPSYRTLLAKRQVTSGAEQLGAFLSAAQMESVKRHENISVSYTRTDSDTWCVGLVSGTTACNCMVTDPAANGACVIDGQLRVFSDANLNNPDIMNFMLGDGAFVYDPARGLMLNPPDPVELKLLSEGGSYSLNVQVSATGRLKICNDSSATLDVPGYKTCS